MIDAEFLRSCDRAAKKVKLNRSELVRLALREHLQRVRILESELRDQRGYEMMPQSNVTKERAWEVEAVWPEDHGFRRVNLSWRRRSASAAMASDPRARLELTFARRGDNLRGRISPWIMRQKPLLLRGRSRGGN
jgi:hypothetical protein